jgi:hypothetical protein
LTDKESRSLLFNSKSKAGVYTLLDLQMEFDCHPQVTFDFTNASTIESVHHGTECDISVNCDERSGGGGPKPVHGTLLTGVAYIVGDNSKLYTISASGNQAPTRKRRLAESTIRIIASNKTTWMQNNDLRKVVYNDEAVRLSKEEINRLNFRNLPVYANHNAGKVIGSVVHGGLEEDTGRVMVTVRVTDPNMIQTIKGNGKLEEPSFSIGYGVRVDDNWNVTHKTVKEISSVKVPFFDGCHVECFGSKDTISTATTKDNGVVIDDVDKNNDTSTSEKGE